MTTPQTASTEATDWRDRVLSDPEMILEDRDLMRALIAANERAMGRNIVDLRGIAMERLEARLDRLEDTHRSVIAAAYENLAGTNQVNRCVLRLLDCGSFAEMLDALDGELSDILRVRSIRLVLETLDRDDTPPHPSVSVVPQGFVSGYVTQGRDAPPRVVTLRQCAEGAPEVFGDASRAIRSEALLRLDLGGALDGMLAFGSEDPGQFRVNQGTELTAFLCGVFERLARRHLA